MGASGAVANAGISWHAVRKGQECVLGGGLQQVSSAGDAELRQPSTRSARRSVGAKSSYSPASGWECRGQDRSAGDDPFRRTMDEDSQGRVVEVVDAGLMHSHQLRRYRVRSDAVAQDTFEMSTSVDASSYSFDEETAPGFTLVDMEGFRQWHIRRIDAAGFRDRASSARRVPRSPSSTIQAEDPVQLGAIAIPRYEPGVFLPVGGTDAVWSATPPEAGTLPAQQFSWEVKR